jgi:hypothetical protein
MGFSPRCVGVRLAAGLRRSTFRHQTVVLSEEWAYDFGIRTATYTPEGASEQRTLRDTHRLLLRNTADGWKLYREVANLDLLPDRMFEQ